MGYDPYNSCRLPKDVPSNAFARVPYGFFRIASEERQKLVDSADTVLALLDGRRSVSWDPALSSAIQCIRQALWRAASTDSPDWFTLFQQFGYPSYERSREMVRSLCELRRWLRDKDVGEYHCSVERFEAANGRQALREFISRADRQQRTKHLAYILWCHEDDGDLVVGAADLPLARLAVELSKSRAGGIYGVLGAWVIQPVDFRITQIALERRLTKFLSPAGNFELTLAAARSTIGKALAECRSGPPEAVARR